MTDPLGRPMTTLEYHPDGRLAAVIDGEGNRVAISGRRRRPPGDGHRPGRRLTTISTFDERGQLVRTNEVYGGRDHVTTYAYDTDKHLVRREDPEGRVWSATYVKGNLATWTDPDGDKVAVTWTDKGLPKTWTEPGGRITTYDWDIEGTLTSVTDPMGEVETYTYNGERPPRDAHRRDGQDDVVDLQPARPDRLDDRPGWGCDQLRVRRDGPSHGDDRRPGPPVDGDLRRRREPVDADRCRRRGHALHLRRPGRRESSGPAVGDGRGLHPRPDRARHAHRRPRRCADPLLLRRHGPDDGHVAGRPGAGGHDVRRSWAGRDDDRPDGCGHDLHLRRGRSEEDRDQPDGRRHDLDLHARRTGEDHGRPGHRADHLHLQGHRRGRDGDGRHRRRHRVALRRGGSSRPDGEPRRYGDRDRLRRLRARHVAGPTSWTATTSSATTTRADWSPSRARVATRSPRTTTRPDAWSAAATSAAR